MVASFVTKLRQATFSSYTIFLFLCVRRRSSGRNNGKKKAARAEIQAAQPDPAVVNLVHLLYLIENRRKADSSPAPRGIGIT